MYRGVRGGGGAGWERKEGGGKGIHPGSLVGYLLDGVLKQVDKPDKRVLVHRLDVGQLRNVEEEHRHMPCHWLVAQTRFINLQPFSH